MPEPMNPGSIQCGDPMALLAKAGAPHVEGTPVLSPLDGAAPGGASAGMRLLYQRSIAGLHPWMMRLRIRCLRPP